MKPLLTASALSLLAIGGVSGAPAAPQTCADGLTTCHNGGSCLKTVGPGSHGHPDYICDCTTATAEGGVLKYAGEFCQHEVKQEHMCSDDMFCVAGGTCEKGVAQMTGVTYYTCDCPPTRDGPHCEYALGESQSCSLTCQNNGQCSKGVKDCGDHGPLCSRFNYTGHIGYEHCICPDGFAGVTCNRQVTNCGTNLKCYHGAQCVEGEDGAKHCDCNAAHTETISYAGLSCEHMSTSSCDALPGQQQEDAFCTNGGTCIVEQGKRHKGCNCPSGFSGDRCEHVGSVGPACTLQCDNGGSCRHGVKGGLEGHEALDSGHENGMHCSCPKGYSGVKCDKKVEICHAEGEKVKHYCFNGAQCKGEGYDSDGEKMFSCDCSQVEESLTTAFAGRFCEHAATEFCTDDTSRSSRSFCTNGGKCKARVSGSEEHKGCDCPAEYTGAHCQLSKDMLETQCGPNKKCYHGGQCVEGENGGKYCDCNTAHTKTTSYAGLSCEHESTSFCDALPGQNQEEAFCTNGGTCIAEQGKRHKGCNCPSGFSGDRCEHVGSVEPACTLQCDNGGSCRHGVKGAAEGFRQHGGHNNNGGARSLAVGGHEVLDGGHQNGMHCSCPRGYTGVKCDTKVEVCHAKGEKAKHYCFNGAQCRNEGNDSSGETTYSCDCSEVEESLSTAFAGRFCEHAATEYCTENTSKSSHSFCTNGGKCKARVSASEAHKGCDCPADYKGAHCQLPKDTLETPIANSEEPATEENSGKNKGVIAGVSLLVIALGAAFAVAIRKGLFRKRHSSPPEIVAVGSLDPDGSTMAKNQETETESQVTSEAEEGDETSNSELELI